MKKIIFSTLLLFSNFNYAQTNVEERLNNLEQTVLDLEIKSLFNKINFSGELRTNFSRENVKHYATAPSKRSNTLISNTLTLNANSNIGKRIKVFSSLQSSFYHGENLAESRAPSNSLLDPVDGDKVRVTKAYFDYHILPKQLIASIGRLSTTDGPPAHFYSLEERLGTYALITYSVPVDGAALSWNISDTLKMSDDLIFRFIWATGERTNRSDARVGLQAGQTANFANITAKDDDYKSLMLEYGTKRFKSFASNINFIGHYIDVSLGRFSSFNQRGLQAGDTQLYEIASTADELVHFDMFSFHADFEDLFKTNFDFYITHKISILTSNGGFTATLIQDDDPTDGFNVGDTAPGFPVSFLGGDSKLIGRSTLLGTRYKFTNSFALGAEYLTQTKGTLPTTSFTQTNTRMYNNIGQSYHTYLTKTFMAKKVITRLGYTNSLSTHVVNLFFREISERSESVYALITLKF